METFIATLSLPIILLNLLSGVVGGIWLIVLGKWVLVVASLLFTIIATWLLGVLLAPILIFIKPLTWATEHRKHHFVFFIAIVSSGWTYIVMLFYTVGSFIYILNTYEGGIKLPYLFLAYAVATSPWTYMAKNESQASEDVGFGTTIPVFGVCVAAFAMIVVSLFYNTSSILLFITCLIPLIFAWIFQIIIIFSTLKQRIRALEASV